MAWTWRLESADGAAWADSDSAAAGGTASLGNQSHTSQSDAESWLGEHWRELREQGVAQVILLDAGEEVYGPMSLAEG